MSTKLKPSGKAYWAVCLALASLHGACAAFLITCARLYWYMEHPYLTYFVDLLAPRQDRHFRLVGTAFGCIGGLHLLRFIELLTPRVVRKWYFEPAFVSKISAAARLSARCGGLSGMRWRIKTLRRQLFGKQGVFGENSHRFDWMAVVMELIQVATQVYQAHRSSYLISRVWVNHCYVMIVVLYCWTTPLLHHFLESYTFNRRVACLAVDALLNISYSIVLPLVIFVPYIYEYDPVAYSFDLSLLYGDLTFGNLVLENQSIFAVSLLECGSKLVPHISVYLSLKNINRLIHQAAARLSYNETSVAPLQVTTALGPNTQDLDNAGVELRPCQRQIYKLIRLTYSCLGAAVLAVHITAVQRFDGVTVLGCKQTMHPWFASKYSCSVFEFNCYRRNLPSLEPESLAFLDENTVTSLVISHCPALVVPQAIQSFPNLLGIEIYNSTIVEWSADAAISASIHRKMVFALFSYVNMTTLPDGILGPLPDMLQDIEISVTNLTSLPDDLHERWHSMSVLYLEYSELEVFPESLFKLEVYDLSLIGNWIQEIPHLLSLQSNYYVLALSHNPLQTLSEVVPSGLAIDFIGLENTKLESLPAWLNTNINEVVYLSGSPVCTQDGSQKAKTAPADGEFVCEEKDPRGDGRFPLALTMPQRVP